MEKLLYEKLYGKFADLRESTHDESFSSIQLRVSLATLLKSDSIAKVLPTNIPIFFRAATLLNTCKRLILKKPVGYKSVTCKNIIK